MALRDLRNNRNTDGLGTGSHDLWALSKLHGAKDCKQGLRKKQQPFQQRNGCESLSASLHHLGNSKQALFTHSNSFTCNKKREEEYMTSEIDLKGSFFLFFFSFELSQPISVLLQFSLSSNRNTRVPFNF